MRLFQYGIRGSVRALPVFFFFGPGGVDADHELALPLALERGELGGSAPQHLLVELGRLADERDLRIPDHLGELGERLGDAVGRLEEEDRLARVADRFEELAPLPRLDRGEVAERELIHRQPRRGHGESDRRNSGDHHRLDAELQRLAHEQKPRIGHGGRTRVRYERQRQPLRDPLGELRGAVVLVEGVKALELRVDVEVRQKLPGMPRILGGDEVDLLQHPERPQSYIFEVPDRCAHQIKFSRHNALPKKYPVSPFEAHALRSASGFRAFSGGPRAPGLPCGFAVLTPARKVVFIYSPLPLVCPDEI